MPYHVEKIGLLCLYVFQTFGNLISVYYFITAGTFSDSLRASSLIKAWKLYHNENFMTL